MDQANAKLAAVAEQLRKGIAPPRETVRAFLLWFGASRRGYRVVKSIRQAMRNHGVATDPDFEWAYIDGQIDFKKADSEKSAAIADDSAPDPTYRLENLEEAHRPPLSVAPDTPIERIVTLMMSRDFSQLPVMTGPRDLKGIVSWKAIGARLALGRPAAHARDVMEEARVLQLHEPLFSAIAAITTHDYVLVQAPDKTISGIVTASDLNNKFRELAEPFLLVGEIENGLRKLLHGKFTLAELQVAKLGADDSRKIETPSDLTIGEYSNLLGREELWQKLGLRIDRVAFIVQLNKVREIRNDVMHFDPDGLEDDDLKTLREFAHFLKRLRDVGACT